MSSNDVPGRKTPHSDGSAPIHLLSRRQAAAWLNISVRKLDALVASGRLACVRLDSCVRFDVKDLEALVDASKEGGAR